MKYEPVEVPPGSEISTDPMHEAVQIHIAGCTQCKEAIDHQAGGTAKFGTRTGMCQEYLHVILMFS